MLLQEDGKSYPRIGDADMYYIVIVAQNPSIPVAEFWSEANTGSCGGR